MKTQLIHEWPGWSSQHTSHVLKTGCLTAAFFIVVEAQVLQGTTINYASSLNRTNFTSSGQVMDCSFRFELGVFKPGFVPSATNTSKWLENWVPAQRTYYNSKNRWFTSNFTVTNNLPPFKVGTLAYVWGFSGCEEHAEWILFSSPTWTWPAPNPETPIFLSWTAKSATTVVLGQIQNSGDFHLRTAAVHGAVPPAVSWEEWRARELVASPKGTPQDLDANGVQDAYDYALHRGACAEPGKWLQWCDMDSERYLEVRIPRRRDRQASFVVEVSDDLVNWRTDPAATRVVEDTAEALVVQDSTPVGQGGTSRYLRVRAVVGP